jgi:hypothetical protein
MEFKRIFLPYKVEEKMDGDNSKNITTTFIPSNYEKTTIAENEIKSLLQNGWEIVSTSPVIGNKNIIVDKWAFRGSFTTGIEVFLVKK